MKEIYHQLQELQEISITRPSHVSFEFFPAKTPEHEQQLHATIQRLAALHPNFMTVTYGAGGSTHDRTVDIAAYIQQHTNIPAAAHITSVNATKDLIHEVLDGYAKKHISKVIALRGDMPGLVGKYEPTPGGYPYAKDLVAGIAAVYDFDISVAGYPEKHPEALSYEADLRYLKEKVDAGSHRIITQYCFDTPTIIQYAKDIKALGVTVPLVIGVMLIANFKQTAKFSAQCGASIPQWLENLYEKAGDDAEAQFAVSVYVAAKQCIELSQAGINQFHFYCLNRYDVAEAVCRILNINPK